MFHPFYELAQSYHELVSFSWAKLLTEWQERAPDVLDTLTAIAVPDNALSRPQRADAIVPPLCTVFSTLLNARNAELSLLQKMVSVVLGLGGCSKMVMYKYKLENILFSLLSVPSTATTINIQMIGEKAYIKPPSIYKSLIFIEGPERLMCPIFPAHILPTSHSQKQHWHPESQTQ